MASISVSFYIGLLVALPVITYQLYAFVIPAFSREHHRAHPAAGADDPVAVPARRGLRLVHRRAGGPGLPAQLQPARFTVQLRAANQIQFVALTLAAMGLIFEMPAVMLTLAKLRIVTAPLMRRTWRYAVVVLAVVAGVLPGADPVSFIAEFVPLLVLYAISYLIVAAVDRRVERQNKTTSTEPEHEAWSA